jgi:hypothetical protein
MPPGIMHTNWLTRDINVIIIIGKNGVCRKGVFGSSLPLRIGPFLTISFKNIRVYDALKEIVGLRGFYLV